MKVVINKCHGGFTLSPIARNRYMQLANTTDMDEEMMPRNDPMLVKVVEELGELANGTFSNLKIVEIPNDVNWEIHEYDGVESIHEVHRIWE